MSPYLAVLTVPFLLAITYPLTVSADRTRIYILGLFPMRGGWSGGISAVPATEMALELINRDQSLLKDYDLQLIWMDTQVCNY